MRLIDWIESGRDPLNSRRIVRGWLADARGHRPLFNRLGKGRAW